MMNRVVVVSSLAVDDVLSRLRRLVGYPSNVIALHATEPYFGTIDERRFDIAEYGDFDGGFPATRLRGEVCAVESGSEVRAEAVLPGGSLIFVRLWIVLCAGVCGIVAYNVIFTGTGSIFGIVFPALFALVAPLIARLMLRSTASRFERVVRQALESTDSASRATNPSD